VRRVLIVAALVLTSCGGSPMAPSVRAPQAAGPLDSGLYLLMLTMATSGTSGSSVCFSVTIGGSPGLVAVIVPTPVQVERSGDTVTVRPDDPTATFRMQLQLAGANLAGTASGQYRSSATTVTVSGPLSAPTAEATGIVGPSSISGTLNGTVSVESMGCSNNGHSWSLTPR
jgi:hypothetical protein